METYTVMSIGAVVAFVIFSALESKTYLSVLDANYYVSERERKRVEWSDAGWRE
jgi:hypothetical protein